MRAAAQITHPEYSLLTPDGEISIRAIHAATRKSANSAHAFDRRRIELAHIKEHGVRRAKLIPTPAPEMSLAVYMRGHKRGHWYMARNQYAMRLHDLGITPGIHLSAWDMASLATDGRMQAVAL